MNTVFPRGTVFTWEWMNHWKPLKIQHEENYHYVFRRDRLFVPNVFFISSLCLCLIPKMTWLMLVVPVTLLLSHQIQCLSTQTSEPCSSKDWCVKTDRNTVQALQTLRMDLNDADGRIGRVMGNDEVHCEIIFWLWWPVFLIHPTYLLLWNSRSLWTSQMHNEIINDVEMIHILCVYLL